MAACSFLADRTVGRLARWLRLLGYDTVFDRTPDAPRLLARAGAEGRVLLTRDTLLVRRRLIARGAIAAVLVCHDDLGDQLAQLRDEIGLRQEAAPRCLVCNSPLERLEVEEVRGRVPPYVVATQECFSHCPVCDRVNWPATHWENMQTRLRELGLAPG